MIPQLVDLVNYKNHHVISRYEKDFPDAKMTGDVALTELMKYMWLCHKHMHDKAASPDDDSLNFACRIHEEMNDIDNMWHTFLLFTRDYHLFCNNYLNGLFFHHVPTTDKTSPSKEEYELELSRYLSYIYDHLGEDTVLKWFE